jgi:outer membrane cobalamin receptor
MYNISYFSKTRQKITLSAATHKFPHFGGLLILFLVLFFTKNLIAQYNTRLSGVIHDSETEQPLAGVIVELIDFHLFSFTNSQGYFEIQNLEPGYYTLSVTSLGYKTILLENISVNLDQLNYLIIELYSQPLIADSVVITAEAERVENFASGNRFIISSQEIESYQTMGLPQLLQQIPGVQIDRTRGGVSNYLLKIHGGKAKHVLVLLDGQRLNNPQTGEIDLNLIPMENIREIEVITQGYSTFHGAGAFDGVINFKTEILKNSKSAKIRTSAGSFSSASGMMGIELASSKFGFAGSYQQNYSKQDFKYFYNGENFNRENAWYQNRGIYTKFNFHQSNHNLFVNYNFSEEYRGLPSAYYNEMKHYDATANSKYHTLLLSHRWLTSSYFYLDNQISYHSIYQAFVNENQPKLNYNDRNVNSNTEINLKASLLPNQAFQTTLGFHYLREKLDAENLLNPAQSIGKQSRESVAVYSGLEWTVPYFRPIFKSANLQAALRFEKAFNFSSDFYPTAGIALVPRHLPFLSLAGNWGKAVQYPDFNSLFWKGDARAQGNPDLSPERKTFWNFSAQLDRLNKLAPKLYFRYFSENIDDLIYWQWTPPNIWQPRNEATVRKTGFDVQLDQEIIEQQLNFKIAYNLTDAVNKDERPNYFNKQIILIPRHSLNTTINGRYAAVGFILSYRYISQRQVTQANTGIPLDAYQLFDFSVNYTLNLKLINTEFGFVTRNIFNENYELIRGYPMPGREIHLSLTLKSNS